jgi:hypothetical protein
MSEGVHVDRSTAIILLRNAGSLEVAVENSHQAGRHVKQVHCSHLLQPAREEWEIRRGQPKHGTTDFHAYATAYAAQHGQRYTLALTSAFGDEDVQTVVQRLVQQVRRLGVKIRFLLLDKDTFPSLSNTLRLHTPNTERCRTICS